ncbi:hypothetical protein [Neisseria sp. Ec49-e6-T10]|uniref:hypothetical protein n=1 Tax=Neisseria sp. Ec49-e6-T10 TaxID=3140744 RepID=UPI003EB9D48E
MTRKRFEQRKLKKCLKKIQGMPLEMQLDMLLENGAWDATEEINKCVTDLEQIIKSGHATGKQLYFCGSWSRFYNEQDKDSIYGNYLNKVFPEYKDGFEMLFWPPSHLKFLCLAAKKRYAPAIYLLSCFYDETAYIDGHREIADRLVNIACKMNHPDALRQRAYIDFKGNDLIKELQRVAALGSCDASMDLELAYKKGSLYKLAAVKKNRRLAKFYNRRFFMK